MSYEKYMKYKTKYLKMKNTIAQTGGNKRKILVLGGTPSIPEERILPENAILYIADKTPYKPSDPEKIKDNLAKQITSSVQWVKTIQFIVSQGVTTFLEIGPGNVLKGLIRKINRELTVYNIQTPGDIENLNI